MYEVIGTRASRAFRVLWMLEEIGEPYRHRPVAPRSEEIIALNPSGKVPALRDGEFVVTDSLAILTYLADRHGQLTHKAGTLDRARQDALTFQIVDEIESLLWFAARHSFILPEERRVPAVKESLKWEYEENLRRLSDRLEGPFLMGADMTIPDILLGHCLRWASIAKFPEPGERLSEYLAGLTEREAYLKVTALP